MPSFFTAYVKAALSSCTDDKGQPLDKHHTPARIAPETMAAMRADCERFCKANYSDLAFLSAEHTGRLFWLIRNRYIGYGDCVPGTRSQRLTDAARAFGPYTLTVQDDKIYGRQG